MRIQLKERKNIFLHKTDILSHKFSGWRSNITVFLIAMGCIILLIRAFYIQVINQNFYTVQGNKRIQRAITIPAVRGSIFDRRGNILAMSQRAVSVFADYMETGVKLSASETKKLSRILNVNYANLVEKLDKKSPFVYLSRQQSFEIGERIARMRMPGIYRVMKWARVYPMGECVSHIIGFAGIDGEGQEGMELSMDASLSSKNGQRTITRDRLGRIIEDRGLMIEARSGNNIHLTIDIRLQYITFSKLQEAVLRHNAKAASAIIVNAKTGEILALANYPSYDPNKFSSRKGVNLRNRAVTDLFEPGSTIKPLNVALAIDSGLVDSSTIIDTSHGKLALGGGYTVKDVSIHERLSVANIVKKSSNVGMVQIMSKLEPKQMWESFRKFGLGSAPAVEFPGIAAGWLMPANRWKPIEQATMSYGYGLSASLLQMIQAYTVFAGDGKLIPVSLIKGQKKTNVHVIRKTTAKKMRSILMASAATKSYVNGYSVAGKSGTTKKLIAGKYDNKHFVSHYIGFLPASRPEIIIAVMVDQPLNGGYYGSVVAAPVFSEIATRSMQFLGIKPDLPVKKTYFIRKSMSKSMK